MQLIPRHLEIINILGKLKRVTVQELTKRLGVSEVTIRKDLTQLEEQGKLLRMHGGAVIAEDDNLIRAITIRWEENVACKQAIARRAKEFIKEGDTVFIDAGSTCFFLAQEVKGMNLRVVTNSLHVLAELANASGISLQAVGGSFRQDAGSFIGPIAEETIKHFQIENCFLGATGINGNGVFSSQNLIESQFKSAVMDIAGRKIVLCDASKYGKKAFAVFANPGEIDVLITDPGFEGKTIMQSLGIEVIFAEV